ncbi:Methylenetetrahydrofolate reductase [Popillia japonica]|uniref:Methylenetetrahydrofolate reductase n=1 Tax=Popillia japonica TaxID=7064 RepID=A0AAW1IEN7_POPJA
MFEILTTIKTIGVKNILAMQGETSLGESKEDFPYAYNLVKYIRETFSDYFCIGVTGYPSGHPRSPNLNEDLAHLKQKIDSGAQFIITQAVFDIDTYRSFYTRCSAVGINVPIVPGLFVINSYSSLIKMARLCKLHLPDDLMKFMQDNKDNADVIEEYGISSFTNIVEQLFNSDDLPIYCVHIFTLNNFDILEKALSRLNL